MTTYKGAWFAASPAHIDNDKPWWLEETDDMPAGRPPTYTDDTRVCLAASGKYKLQQASDRRAVVQLLVDNAGCMTLGEINKHFGFDIRHRVMALVRLGWLEVQP